MWVLLDYLPGTKNYRYDINLVKAYDINSARNSERMKKRENGGLTCGFFILACPYKSRLPTTR